MSPATMIELTIDGKKVAVPAGTTVFDAARMNDIEIPTLCHQQNEKPVGVCRVCVVDVGRQGVHGVLRASRRERHGRHHQFGQSQASAQHAGRIADVGPSQPLRSRAPDPAIANLKRWQSRITVCNLATRRSLPAAA